MVISDNDVDTDVDFKASNLSLTSWNRPVECGDFCIYTMLGIIIFGTATTLGIYGLGIIKLFLWTTGL